MATLLMLLRDRLGVSFEGEQFVGCWQPLAVRDRARLQGALSGRRALAPALGQGATLGARAWDQSAGIAVRAPPLPAQRFAALLPGGAQAELLAWLVARHLQRDVTVTLTLTLAASPTTRLGRDAAQPLAPRLGRSAWLCSRTDAAFAERAVDAYRSVRVVLAVPNTSLPERS